MILYVWSGSLRGVPVETEDAYEAVEFAVREHTPCVLGPAIRVSKQPKGLHAGDVYIVPPYEDEFPSLFDGELDVTVVPVEEL